MTVHNAMYYATVDAGIKPLHQSIDESSHAHGYIISILYTQHHTRHVVSHMLLECTQSMHSRVHIPTLLVPSLKTMMWLSRNGGPALCTSSFGPSPYLDREGIQPKTDGTAEIYTPLYLYNYA